MWSPGEAVVAADQHPQPAFPQFTVDVGAVLDLLRQAPGSRLFRRDAPWGRLIKGVVKEPKGGCQEHSVLVFLQHIDRVIIGEFAVVEEFDAML